MAGKVTFAGERLLIAAALAGVGTLTMHLIKAAFSVTDTLAISDVTEADYAGYASITMTFSGLEAGNPGGKAVADFADCVFSCSGSTTPNDIYGYWIQNVAGDVIFAERFGGTARPMKLPGQTVVVPFTLRMWSPV